MQMCLSSSHLSHDDPDDGEHMLRHCRGGGSYGDNG